MSLTGSPLDLVIALFAGVAMSFTPCMYPILPVVAATVAGVNVSGRPLNGFFLALVYVLGLAVSYSALAVVAALTGQIFGSLQNNPWVFLVVGNFFLLFALVMLDVIPLPMMALAGSVRGKGVWALFGMGFASGFIVGPCTAPVLGSLLVFVGSKQNIPQAIMLLFMFALGSGASVLLAGTFSGFIASLPKAGRWMEWVKRIAGIVLIILAEVYLMKAGQLF